MFSLFKKREERKRNIYEYSDGSTMRAIDPVRALREMYNDERCVLDRHPTAAADGDSEAIEITVAMVQRVFGVKPLEKVGNKFTGLTDEECFALLDDFSAYLAALKKNGSGPQIGPAAGGSMSLDPSVTKPLSDCGSTKSESPPADPLAC